MKIIYTKHASLRINERELSKKYIEDTLNCPKKILSSFKGRQIAQREFGGKTLEVVYKRINGETVVITAYWLKLKED